MITRDDIATALGTIPGLGPSRTTPRVIQPYSAWPVWLSTRWLNAKGQRETRWYVFVALTNGERDASVEAGDAMVEAVIDALWSIGLGGLEVEPVQWAVEVGGSPVPCLRFTCVE